jgi:hypothetical protein
MSTGILKDPRKTYSFLVWLFAMGEVICQDGGEKAPACIQAQEER